MYEPRFHVVLHSPQIPHNTGSVGRTCTALGAKLWLIRPFGFRLDDYYLRRAGLDYWEHLYWEPVDDWAALLDRLPDARLWLFTKKAKKLYTDVQFSANDVIVFGCEQTGLPDALLEQYPERLLRIPMRPEARSLNLSNSVAIVSYEMVRQLGVDISAPAAE